MNKTIMSTTFVTGYWKINENVKYKYETHYKNLFENSFKILKDCNIVCFYDDDNILSELKRTKKTNNIIFLKIHVEDLHTYNISQNYLNTCKVQDNKTLRKINTVNEKGLVHYDREYMGSGESGFRKVFTVWTSKLFLVNEIINVNPFNTDTFAWIDISISRFNRRDTYKYTQYYPTDKIYHFSNNIMRYYGELLPLLAAFLIADKNVWKTMIPLYNEKLLSLKDSEYAHDEETILTLIQKDHPEFFQDIDKIIISNFDSAKKYVEMKIKHNEETLSGVGSYIENTKETVQLITQTINCYDIKTILDLGCGDWNWFKTINLNDDISYIGWDAHTDMIAQNQNRFGRSNINFYVKDIVTTEYPKVDLIICRDVLFHLNIKLAIQVITKISKSCKFFIATSFNDAEKNFNIVKYCNIHNWGFHKINLNIHPFNLEKNIIQQVNEINNGINKVKRYINLYKF